MVLYREFHKNGTIQNLFLGLTVRLIFLFRIFVLIGTCDPVFGATFSFPTLMTPELDLYLRNDVLQIYVLDDNDPGMLAVYSVTLRRWRDGGLNVSRMER